MARYAGSRPRSGGGSVVMEAGGTQRNATQRKARSTETWSQLTMTELNTTSLILFIYIYKYRNIYVLHFLF